MEEKTRLILAIQQIENIVSLSRNNEWKNYIYGHLNSVHVELHRQLSLLTHGEENKQKD